MRPPVLVSLFVVMVAGSSSRGQEPIPYGGPVRLEEALKVVAAAEAEARKHDWPVAIAVVDNAGFLVALHRLDNTQLGSIEVAVEKAKSSTLFRRPTKVFEDALAQGGANLRALKSPSVMPIEGGLPLIRDGKIIGAIGVSGVKPAQDGEVARAGGAGLEGVVPRPSP